MSFTVPNQFVPSTVADANAVNANFGAVVTEINQLIEGGGIGSVIPATVNAGAINLFNVLFYGVSLSNTPGGNSVAFASAISDMIVNNGGSILIPNLGSPIQLSSTINLNPGTSWVNTIFGGTSNAQKLSFSAPGDGIYLQNVGFSGGADKGGSYLHDLQLVAASTVTAGIGLHIQAAQNTFCERIVIAEFPTGVQFDNSLTNDIRDIQLFYSNNLSATGIHITGPVGAQDAANQIEVHRATVIFNSPGVAGSYGCLIDKVVHATIFDSYFTGQWIGIGLTPSSSNADDVKQVRIIATQIGSVQYGIFCQPQSASGSRLLDFQILGGQNQAGNSATGTSVGVYIDTNGGTNNQVDQGEFVSQKTFSWGLYGVQINGGQNLKWIGGSIGSNGTAGVAITGAPQNVLFQGVDLSATYENNPAQTYAILYSGTGGDAKFDNCPMIGYGGSPVNVTGAPGTLVIINCKGYNDQQTIITQTAPSSNSSVNAASVGGYYGPSTLFVSGGTVSNISVGMSSNPAMQKSTGLTSGPIPLAPNEFITITYSVTPTVLWTGS